MMSVYLDTPWGSSINASTPAAVLDTRSWMGLDQPLFLMEFGIEDPTRGIHGDEEFLYVVELPANAGKQSEAGDWYVRIASLERKRRSAEERARAFDDARWQFDGPLGEAAERYGIDQRH